MSEPPAHNKNHSKVSSYPNSRFREVGPGGYLFPGRHVWISVPLERCLQLLELLAGEVGPLTSLTSQLFVRPVTTAALSRAVLTPCLLVGGPPTDLALIAR